jgi:hypothetical protein
MVGQKWYQLPALSLLFVRLNFLFNFKGTKSVKDNKTGFSF